MNMYPSQLNQFIKNDQNIIYKEGDVKFKVLPGDDKGFVKGYSVDVIEEGTYFNTIYHNNPKMPKSVDGLIAGSTQIGGKEISCIIILELEEDSPNPRETINIGTLSSKSLIPENIWNGIRQIISSINHFCPDNHDDSIPDNGALLHHFAKTNSHDIGLYPVHTNHKVIGLLVTCEFPDRQNLLGIYKVEYQNEHNEIIQKTCPIILLEDREPQFEYSFNDLIFELAQYAPEISL